MFLLHVIVFMYVFCQLSYSRTLTGKTLDLRGGVRFTWNLRMNNDGGLLMNIHIALPEKFRWLAIGFHNVPFRHTIWEDIALISIEEDGGQEVSFLKTLHMDEANKISDSKQDLYDWAKRGRRKSGGYYYFTLERKLKYLKTCDPVKLVWGYGEDIGKKEYPDYLVEQLQFRILTLDKSRKFVCTPYYKEAEEEEPADNNEEDSDVDDEKAKGMPEPENADSVVEPTEETEHSNVITGESNHVGPTEKVKSTSQPNTTRESNEKSTENKSSNITTPVVPTSESNLPVKDETNEKEVKMPETDITTINPVTKPNVPIKDSDKEVKVSEADITTRNPVTKSNVPIKDSEKEVKVSEADITTRNPVTKPSVTIKDNEKEVKVSSADTTGKPGKEDRSMCKIDPCSYSQCPTDTRCIPNFIHCTSACTERGSNTTENITNTNCACTNGKGGHWYDFFKNNENSVYFAVIGISALFTGAIVLCLACCCARKGQTVKLRRQLRKNKVSFYKVDDFESSADEEVEFLGDDEHDVVKGVK